MILLDTKAYEKANDGKAPRGSHWWRFSYDGIAVETDGPFPQARDWALRRFREMLGRQSDAVVILEPRRYT